MMTEYFNKYYEQMDKIILSDTADQKILNDLLKEQARQKETCIRRPPQSIRASAVAAILILVLLFAAVTSAAIHGIIVKSQKEKTKIQGISTVELGESYYYDLLSGNSGEIYALTDNDYNSSLTDSHVIVWKSTDQGSTWESVFFQPDQSDPESFLFGGDLYMGENGLETSVLIEEADPDNNGSWHYRMYRITSDSETEYNMNEVYALLGGPDRLFNIKYVNDHVIAFLSSDKCLFYDMDAQSVIKELPYNLTMGCLRTEKQFLLYGKDIYYCIDTDNLDEAIPEESLQIFVQSMYAENGNHVFPPMQAQDNTIICITKSGIYEYRDGETKQIREGSGYYIGYLGGSELNGLLPICKGRQNEYYVCTYHGAGMSLWLINNDSVEIK